jgi:diguanylate cyclase (GGDEF)-like protein
MEEKELIPLQLRNIRVMTHMLEHNVVSDEILDALRENELDYFSLLDKYELLQKTSNIDQKTRLLRYKQDYLTNIVKTASRFYYRLRNRDYFLSFVRFDIDNFSSFNTKYGHSFGDDVLYKVAETIKSISRPTDYVIRFGGEEFDVILPATRAETAGPYLDKVLNRIRKLGLVFEGEPVKLTASAGLTGTTYVFGDTPFIDDKETETLYGRLQEEADNALYEAKATGKDRWCVFDPAKIEEYKKIRAAYNKTG